MITFSLIYRDIKEGFIVSGSGTVLDQIDGNHSDDSPANPSKDGISRDYLTSDKVVLEELSLGVIDSGTKIEALRVLRTDGQTLDEDYVRKVADALGFSEEQYNDFARVNINKESEDYGVELEGKTSVKSRLDLSMLDDIIVKDLPEIIRTKLLSILRLQRQRKRRQRKKRTTENGPDSVEEDTQNANISGSLKIQGMDDDEDVENDANLFDKGRSAAMKRNRKRRESMGKKGILHGTRESMGDISEQENRKFYRMVVYDGRQVTRGLGFVLSLRLGINKVEATSKNTIILFYAQAQH